MSLKLSRLEQNIGMSISLTGILICWVYLSIMFILLKGYMIASFITMGVGTLISWAYLINLLRTYRPPRGRLHRRGEDCLVGRVFP